MNPSQTCRLPAVRDQITLSGPIVSALEARLDDILVSMVTMMEILARPLRADPLGYALVIGDTLACRVGQVIANDQAWAARLAPIDSRTGVKPFRERDRHSTVERLGRPAIRRPSFPLEGRVTMVTGVNRRLDRDLALAPSGAGAKVIATVRKPEMHDDVITAIEADGGEATAARLDLTDRATLMMPSRRVWSAYAYSTSPSTTPASA